MRRAALCILIFFFNLSFSQMMDDLLEPSGQTHLVLNTIVLHDNNSDFRTGFKPVNGMENQGSLGKGTMRLYTAYISTNQETRQQHIQTLELWSPGKKRLLYRKSQAFFIKDTKVRSGTFQRAFLEQEVVFPSLSRQKRSDFGIYTIIVSLNGKKIREFLVPVYTK